jgi:hypothetical protein
MGRALIGVGLAALLALSTGCGDDDDGSEADHAPAAPVANEDHWHAAFGVYVCDHFQPPMPQFEDPDGIHTHGDGVIHIHPFTPRVAGENATLGVFLDAAGIEVSGDRLSVGGETYTAGEDTCGGQESEVVVARWADVRAADAEAERVGADARFRRDGEGYVVAFVPVGATVPVPESAAELDRLEGGSTTTAAPDTAGDREAAPAPDERELADGFYPVEVVEPAPCRTPGMRADQANENCFRLPDEPALGTDVVEDAEASLSPTIGGNAWQVALTLTDGGIGAFNEVAARCYLRDTTCPTGQLALVVDDEIVFAPMIQQPSYERDQISVTGSFTEDEARSLADALAPR